MTTHIKIERIDKEIPLPKKQHSTDCCFDLMSSQDITIYPNMPLPTMVPTGIKVQLDPEWEMQIRSRSGIAKDYNVKVAQGIGTIDAGFRGQVFVLLINDGEEPFYIKKKDRIAQAKISPVPKVIIMEVDKVDETERGEGGFGHTGI